MVFGLRIGGDRRVCWDLPCVPLMRIRPVLKSLSLGLVLCLAVILLWPPADKGAEPVPGAADRADARYVIKMSPGLNNMPGKRPFGIGEPLTGFTEVIQAFERRFPDTRIELVTVPGVREYLVTQLSSGAAPDVVAVNVEDVWVDVQKGWYVPLDEFLSAPNPFVVEQGNPDAPGTVEWWDMFKYQALSRGKAAPNNLNYCLTLSAVETGIFYNKTYFAEHGLRVPETWAELLDVSAAIKADGRIPLMVTMSSLADWTTDLVFDQFYYDLLPGIDLIQDPIREGYLEGYLDGEELAFLFTKGFFTREDPRWVEMARVIREFRSGLQRSLVDGEFMREFVNQEGIMMWSSSRSAYPIAMNKDLGFEWGVFYLPPITKATSSLASGHPMCVIGGAAQQYEVTNSAVKDTDPNLPLEDRMAQSERLKRVIAFLQFLCLPENTDRVVNEYPCFLPNIVGVDGLPVLQPFDEILERRYTTTKWVFSFDLRFTDITARMLGLYLADGIDRDGYLKWQEDNIRTAGESILRRKGVDLAVMEARWRELAPVRDGFTNLPRDGGDEP